MPRERRSRSFCTLSGLTLIATDRGKIPSRERRSRARCALLRFGRLSPPSPAHPFDSCTRPLSAPKRAHPLGRCLPMLLAELVVRSTSGINTLEWLLLSPSPPTRTAARSPLHAHRCHLARSHHNHCTLIACCEQGSATVPDDGERWLAINAHGVARDSS